MLKIYYIFIFLILIIGIVPVNGAIIYNVDTNLKIGEWGVSGNSLDKLNSPNHIFNNVQQKTLILTDTGNNRVEIYNQNNWTLNKVIDTFILSNGSNFQLDSIYETVQMTNNTLYSVIQTGKIMRYDESGKISGIYSLPITIPIGSQMHIAVDVNTNPNRILLSFYNESYYDVSVIDMGDYLQNHEFTPLTSLQSNELQFSYNGTNPMMFTQTSEQSQSNITLITFHILNTEYQVQKQIIHYDTYIYNSHFYLSQAFTKSFLVINHDFIFSTEHNFTGILFNNGEHAESLQQINNLGSFHTISSMIYDYVNQRLVFVIAEQHCVVALKLSGYSQDNSTNLFDQLLQPVPIIVASLVVIAIIVFIIYRRKIGKRNESLHG